MVMWPMDVAPDVWWWWVLVTMTWHFHVVISDK